MTIRSLILTFVLLVVLAAGSWIAASEGTGTAVALAIAAAKAIAIALVFMELAHAHAVDKVIAVIAVLFVVLLCAGTAVDVQLR